MSETNISVVTNQVQKFWSPVFVPELKEKTILPALVNKDYQGQIKKAGDTVYVSQIKVPDGQIKTIGVDADYNTFSADRMQTARIAIQANKVITAAFEIDDIVDLQSQINEENPEIRRVLLKSVELKLNTYLQSLEAPSSSTPDHTVTGVADFNASQLAAVRKLAAQAKWDKLKGWFGLLDPSYYSDFLNAQTMVSNDYGASDEPLIGGQFAKKRHGFYILEDDSRAVDKGHFFHPDYLHLVMQEMPTFKISDLHSQKKHGYLISVRLIVGAALGIEGNLKHISVSA